MTRARGIAGAVGAGVGADSVGHGGVGRQRCRGWTHGGDDIGESVGRVQ